MYFDGPNSRRNFIIAVVCGFLAVSILIFGIIALITSFVSPSPEPEGGQQPTSGNNQDQNRPSTGGGGGSTPTQPETPNTPEEPEKPEEPEEPENPENPEQPGSQIPSEPETVPATGITLTPDTVTINVGDKKTIVAVLEPKNTTDKVSWSSSNTSIVTVNASGMITGIKAGSAYITAKANSDVIATSYVTVKAKSDPAPSKPQPTIIYPTSIKLDKTSASIVVDKTATLKATIIPNNASNTSVSWSTSNANIATVSKGVVTGKKAGTATITAKTHNGKTATAKITVTSGTVAVTGVTISPKSATIKVGGTTTFTASVVPSNATEKKITWSSSNTNIATVSNGVVTGKKAGSATITAYSLNGKTATATVTVTANTPTEVLPTGVKLSASSASVKVNGTYRLTATVTPSNATNQTITWSSSNTSVATVVGGTVTGKKAGTAVITAKTHNGKTATATITVSNGTVAVTGVKLNVSKANVKTNGTYKLTATVTPSNATDKTVTWSSNKTTIATVSGGTVSGKKAGTATITVRTSNGKTASATITVADVAATGVTVSGNESVMVGETITLSATVSPSDTTNKTVTWATSDSKVATISSKGKITPKKTGYVTLTAKTHNGKTRTKRVYVYSSSDDFVKTYYLNLTSNVAAIDKERKAAKADAISGNQGIILETRDKKFILFDTANKSKAIRNIIYNRLKKAQGGAKKVVIDYIILSHHDGDHNGNLKELIDDDNILVKNVVMKYEVTAGKGKKFESFAQSAAKEGATIYASPNLTVAGVRKLAKDNNAKVMILSEEMKINVGKYVDVYLYNVNDIYAKFVKDGKSPCKSGHMIKFTASPNVKSTDYTMVKSGKNYVYFDGSKYPKVTFKTTSKVIKKSGGSGINRYFYAVETSGNANICRSNANSIAAFVSVSVPGANKYIFINGDLDNNSYDIAPTNGVFGNNGTVIYNKATYNTKTKKFTGEIGRLKVPAETNVANAIANSSKFKGKLGNIVFFEASHHGLNSAPDAINIMGMSSNKKAYVIEMTKTNSANVSSFMRTRTYYYTFKNIPASHKFRAGGGSNGVYCNITSKVVSSCKYF